MPQHTTPRQPVSCENCRKRKIKCRSGQMPCATCVKRGYAQTCYYKRNADESQPSTTTSSSSHGNESELLHRVRNLENLLKQQIAQSSQTSPEHRLGPFTQSTESSPRFGPETSSRTPTVRQRGTIVTSPAGYQHFVPRGDCLGASLVHELTDSVPSPLSQSNFPFSSDTTSSKNMLLDMLPPLRQCDELKDIFSEVFSPLFHILHDPTFDAAYDQFRIDPSTVLLSWLALLFVILGIAVTALDESHPLLRDLGREPLAAANIKKLSARYRSAAMQCLTADQFMYQHNLQTLQALILLIYAMNHANISSWALLGLTWNVAVRIGCHIDPSRLGLGVIESEERRRCWAALMMLYIVQNTCLGNSAPQTITADVDLPANVDDDKLGNHQSSGNGSSDDISGLSKMSYILFKFRLYKIAAAICQSALDERLTDHETILALDQKLANEEHEHHSRFSAQDLPMYHIVHHYILRSYTHHLYLVLHRGSLNVPGPGHDAMPQSRQRCKSSATTILEIHGHLYETAEFRPYQWYVYGLGSFHAFLAVSVLIMLSRTPEVAHEEKYCLYTLVEQCVHRFEVMADRSDICARAAVILRRVLQNGIPSGLRQSVVEDNNNNAVLQGESLQQYPISPICSPEYAPTNMYDWNSNPELEALLFEMAPQQWMAPNAFTWDRWGTTAVT